ncbi:Uncharacterised protein [Serratia fonticola]|uniref:hypothetical protein n=1 Tax=Serratia fonticola TaxID=47917 RepID=UPI0021772F1E|nr:hypothetical protein [Serratia fonticola]CAI1922975.1 Uncharacterised protein [Serratia fonticola]
MSKLTLEENAAYDIMDFLHFHSLNAWLFIDDVAGESYANIQSAIEEAMQKHNFSELDATIVNHYLLCGLEIALSGDEINLERAKEYLDIGDVERVIKHITSISLAILLLLAEANGVNKKILLELLFDLLEKDFILKISPAIRFRLATNALCFEYPLAGLHFHRHLCNVGFACAAKFRPKNSIESSEFIFVRVGLLMEFEQLRATLGDLAWGFSLNEYTLKTPSKNISIDLRKYLIGYITHHVEKMLGEEYILFHFKARESASILTAKWLLMRVGQFFKHKRLFDGEKWSLGVWGALLIGLIKKDNPDIAIFYAQKNTGTASYEARKILASWGYSVTARVLRDNYSSFNDTQRLVVERYFNMLSQLQCTPEWSAENFFYNEALLPGFTVAVHQPK